MNIELSTAYLKKLCRNCLSSGEINLWTGKVKLPGSDEETTAYEMLQAFDNPEHAILDYSNEVQLLCTGCLKKMINFYNFYQEMTAANKLLKELYDEALKYQAENENIEFLNDNQEIVQAQSLEFGETLSEDDDDTEPNQNQIADIIELQTQQVQEQKENKLKHKLDRNWNMPTEDYSAKAQKPIYLKRVRKNSEEKYDALIEEENHDYQDDENQQQDYLDVEVKQEIKEEFIEEFSNIEQGHEHEHFEALPIDKDVQIIDSSHLDQVGSLSGYILVKEMTDDDVFAAALKPSEYNIDIENLTVFTCAYCPHAFTSREFLIMHARKTHICVYCSTGFIKTSDLHQHKRAQHRNDCTICNRVLSTANNLRSHIRSVHNIDIPEQCILMRSIQIKDEDDD